jgi:hypothetical protein
MDINTLPVILGTATALGTAVGWVWKTGASLRRQVLLSRDEAEVARKFTADLLDRATSAARRADIHAYLQFRCIEFESARTRLHIQLVGAGAFTLLIALVLTVLGKALDMSAAPLLWWAALLTFASLVISLAIVVFTSVNLNRIYEGWQTGARAALYERAKRHVAEHLQEGKDS